MERLPGFRDFYPEPLPTTDVWSTAARQYIFDTWRAVADTYGFQEYDGPPLEPLELYTNKSGDEIVGQLYTFTDKGDRAVALRPEMTPTLARMIAAHQRNYKKPIKWFAIPQLFRYERQQKGRLREHFQFNADLIGESAPAADAELIALLIDSLRALKLTSDDFVVRLSSRDAWQSFLTSRSFDLAKAYQFFQIIDKLDRVEPAESEAKLKPLGLAFSEITDFIEAGKPTEALGAILQNLAARGLGDFVKIDYRIIRGLAYYTGTVFEAFDKKGEFRAIAGGGRYDDLVRRTSGGKTDLPALGFGMGDVVLLELLQQRGVLPTFVPRLDVYCLIEDEALRDRTMSVVQAFRSAKLSCDYSLVALKPDKQFKRAQESNARLIARLESPPAGSLALKLKNLATREEKLCTLDEAIEIARNTEPGTSNSEL